MGIKKTRHEIVTHEGIVTAIVDRTVFVRLMVSSACAGCHARHLCSGSEKKDKVVEATNLHQLPLQIGDNVIVSLQQKLAMKAVALGFLYPFLLLFVGFIAISQLIGNELIAGLSSLILLAIYYLFLWLFRKKISKTYIFVVQPTPAISPTQTASL